MTHIREFQPTAQDYTEAAAILNATWPESPVSAQALRAADSYREAKYIHRRFLAERDGRAVGLGIFHHLVPWLHHPQRFDIQISVPPAHRGQGNGHALYHHLLDAMAGHNPLELYAVSTEDRPEALRFIKQRGFTEAQRKVKTWLDTARFDFAPFTGIEEKLRSQEVEIKTFAELASDPARDHKLHTLSWTLDLDIPHFAAPTPTPFNEFMRLRSAHNPRFLPDALFIAVCGGEYIGISELNASADGNEFEMDMTGVRPEFRRMGIALALKLRTIAYATTHGSRIIRTWTDANNPMLGLNLKLGFVRQPTTIIHVRRL